MENLAGMKAMVELVAGKKGKSDIDGVFKTIGIYKTKIDNIEAMLKILCLKNGIKLTAEEKKPEGVNNAKPEDKTEAPKPT
jgi:endonuclease III